MKINRAYLENKIFQLLQNTSKNTPHFNYKVNFEEGSITLEVYTYNPLQKGFHFLHKITSDTPIDCLRHMVLYLENHGDIKKERTPYTITWVRKGSNIENKSYYYEVSEQDAIEKFLYGKNPNLYEIEIRQNPLS